MEFIFKATEYDEISFKSQVSKALEIRTELLSRKEHLNYGNLLIN